MRFSHQRRGVRELSRIRPSGSSRYQTTAWRGWPSSSVEATEATWGCSRNARTASDRATVGGHRPMVCRAPRRRVAGRYDQDHGPDARRPSRGRRVTWTAYAYLCVVGFLRYVIGALTPYLRDELHVSAATAALHASLLALGVMAAGTTADAVERRLGRRVTGVLAGGLVVAGALAVMLGGTPPGHPRRRVRRSARGGRDAGGDQPRAGQPGWRAGGGPVREGQRLGPGGLDVRPAADRGGSPRRRWAGRRCCVVPVGRGHRPRGHGWAAGRGAPRVADGSRARCRGRSGSPGSSSSRRCRSSSPMSSGARRSSRRRPGVSREAATALATLFILGMLVGRIALGAGLVGNARWRHWVEASLGIAAAGGFVVWLATTPSPARPACSSPGSGPGSLYPLGLASALDRAGDAALAAGARLTLASGIAILTMPLLLGAVADNLGVVAGWPLVIGLCLVAFGSAPPLVRALSRALASRDAGRPRARAPGQRSRSPASIRAASRFSGGASGHAHLGSKAHDGWNAKLRSTTSVPAAGSPPRSAPFARVEEVAPGAVRLRRRSSRRGTAGTGRRRSRASRTATASASPSGSGSADASDAIERERRRPRCSGRARPPSPPSPGAGGGDGSAAATRTAADRRTASGGPGTPLAPRRAPATTGGPR